MSIPYGITVDKGNRPDFVASATAAITYVTDPEVWPQFVAWITENHPDVAKDGLADKRELIAWHAHELLRAWSLGS